LSAEPTSVTTFVDRDLLARGPRGHPRHLPIQISFSGPLTTRAYATVRPCRAVSAVTSLTRISRPTRCARTGNSPA
jgi:hypothetical protein